MPMRPLIQVETMPTGPRPRRTEGEDDRRAEDRHQQQWFQPSAAGHVGADHDEGEHGADRHGDHRHAEGHRQRRREGAPEVEILDDELVGAEGECATA